MPWREKITPYHVFVSEVMLQQTQVARVMEKFSPFVKLFPNFKKLAEAPLCDLLLAWQGMGYNRRALYLKKAAETGKLKNLEGLGEKSEERILKSIAFLEQSHGRFSIATALPLSRRIIERLRSLPEVQKAEFAGSIARMQETVGDLDILVISSKPSKVTDFFVEMPEVQEVKSYPAGIFRRRLAVFYR